MPNTAKLIERGIWAENCLVPHPTITPPNWTTIVTGAWPGTHGITCFNVHNPGDPLDQTHPGFVTDDCRAEYIWTTAEKVGKKTILFNYPSTWPPTLKEGIQIAGAGLSLNEWRVYPKAPAFDVTLSADLLFATEEYPQASLIELKEASGWKNVPTSHRSLEAEIQLRYRNPRVPVKEKTWYLLVQDTKGEGYDKVILSKSKDGKDALATLTLGQWSGKIVEEFETEQGIKRAVFMCKLLELSGDGQTLKFYLTPICQLDGWSFPEEVASELENIEGLPMPASFVPSFNMEWFDLETLLQLWDMQHVWYAEAAYHLLKKYDWSLFFMHAHCPDHAYHAFINKLEPSVCRDKDELAKYQQAEAQFHQSLDRMIGRILEAADEETLVIITSDHGAVPTENRFEPDYQPFSVAKLLEEAGLTVYKEDPQTGERVIDWEKTRAVAQRSVYIYVNLKGRDPQGVVEPGEEYEKVCDEIINVLYDYTDPKTGKKPIAFALKREDARMLGLYGDMVGDVIYGIRAEFSGEHGRQLPTGEFGMGSMKGLLIMSGPNIKKNYVLTRTVWLTDIVPTICYLMDLPVPRDCEGAIIYQALEDPDLKLHELETLRKNYARLKRAYEGESSLTHRYD